MPRAFERPATIALPGADGASGLALEGLHVASDEPARAAAVIAAPHPLYGGSMHHPVVTELAQACARSGVESLRFNWRGVGASAGELCGDDRVADEDFGAALAFLADGAPQLPQIAGGYSFGAAAAVRAGSARPRITRLLLVAPPPALLDREALLGFTGRVFLVAGERDALAPAGELEALAAAHPNASFESIADADHFFGVGLPALQRAARSRLAEHG